MKTSQTKIVLILLSLSACSGFSSWSNNNVSPSIIPSPVSAISSLTPVSTKMTTSTPSNETCQSQAISWNSETSPNGDWVAVNCKGMDDEKSTYLYIINNQDGRSWDINYTAYKPNILFELDGKFPSLHWSRNGENLYFEKHEPIYEGDVYPMGNVLRIDLITGQVHDIFSEFTEIAYTFSPDDKYLLYIAPHANLNKAYVLDLSLGQVKTIEMNEEYLSSGPWGLWANDNKTFVLSLSGKNDLHSLALINVASPTQTTFVSNLTQLLYPIEWRDESTVLLTNSIFYNRFENSELWLLDINTREMSRIK